MISAHLPYFRILILKLRYILLDVCRFLHHRATILRLPVCWMTLKPILQKRSKLLLSCAPKLSESVGSFKLGCKSLVTLFEGILFRWNNSGSQRLNSDVKESFHCLPLWLSSVKENYIFWLAHFLENLVNLSPIWLESCAASLFSSPKILSNSSLLWRSQ